MGNFTSTASLADRLSYTRRVGPIDVICAAVHWTVKFLSRASATVSTKAGLGKRRPTA